LFQKTETTEIMITQSIVFIASANGFESRDCYEDWIFNNQKLELDFWKIEQS
jgi:hypothetical protein